MKRARLACLAALLAALVLGSALAADRAAAAKALEKAVKKDDAAAIDEALEDLVASAGKESLAPILAHVAKAEGATYWRLVSAAGSFHDEPALDELGRWIVAHQKEARSPSGDLVFVLGANGSPSATKALALVLEKGALELQLMAADALAALRSKDAIAALEAAESRVKHDSELRRRIESALATAKDAAGGKVRDRELGQTRERAKDSEVVVLSADRTGAGTDERDNDFDRIQAILERHEVPHRVVKKFEFEKDPKKALEGVKALLVNCNRINEYCACPKCGEAPVAGPGANRLSAGCNPACSVHTIACYKLSDASLAAIKAWVETRNGFLYTEDWGILDVTGRAWPERVVATPSSGKPLLLRVRTRDGQSWERHFDVRLRPARGAASHPFMRGVWQRAAAPAAEPAKENATTERAFEPGWIFEHRWQVDDEAPAIHVVDEKNVTTLLESDDVARLAGGDGAVAVTFRPGARPGPKTGRVLHTMSHFGHQDTTSDGAALENVLLDFLLEAARAR